MLYANFFITRISLLYYLLHPSDQYQYSLLIISNSMNKQKSELLFTVRYRFNWLNKCVQWSVWTYILCNGYLRKNEMKCNRISIEKQMPWFVGQQCNKQTFYIETERTNAENKNETSRLVRLLCSRLVYFVLVLRWILLVSFASYFCILFSFSFWSSHLISNK